MPATLFLTLRSPIHVFFFFFNDTATTEIYTLSLHDALPIFFRQLQRLSLSYHDSVGTADSAYRIQNDAQAIRDRKSTRLNSSHGYISYAVFCLKKKNENIKLVGVCVARRTAINRRSPSKVGC